jgi:ankyrin repeat protein
MTPLMFASREGNLRVLKYLIELTDINIDQQDENGWTVIIKSSLFRSFYLNDLFRVLFTRAIKAILNVYVSY